MKQPDFAQDPKELFDVVTFDGRPTGLAKPRGKVHRDGDWHRSVHVWVIGEDANGPFLTFQRRSSAKDTWPGRLDATVGGHLRAGEEVEETLRETEEEIGIAVDPADVRSIGVRVCVSDGEAGVRDHELQSVFLHRDDRPLTIFQPNPAELAGMARFPISGLLGLFSGETDALRGSGIVPGSDVIAPVTVARTDFIIMHDRYFWRVARAARAALAGDPYATI